MARKKGQKVTAKQKAERATAKAEKFVELASKRVNATIGRIRLLKNLANKNSYSYTESQVEKIFTALQEELDEVRDSFSATEEKAKSSGFSFD